MLEVPMYRADGTRIQLADLLAKVAKNDWTWSVIEFDGVGGIPSGESIVELQRKLLEQPKGLFFKWNEMLKFAGNIEYTIDCLIVAISSAEQLDVSQVLADNFIGCEVALRAIDSTEWLIFSSDQALLVQLGMSSQAFPG